MSRAKPGVLSEEEGEEEKEDEEDDEEEEEIINTPNIFIFFYLSLLLLLPGNVAVSSAMCPFKTSVKANFCLFVVVVSLVIDIIGKKRGDSST